MARLLFRLRHVTDEEAMEVRQLLDAHHIDVYETQAGVFRLGVDAIWLRNPAQYEDAQGLLDTYQAERLARSREAHRQAQSRGDAQTLMDRLRARPRRMLLTLLGVAAIIGISLLPFIGLMRS